MFKTRLAILISVIAIGVVAVFALNAFPFLQKEQQTSLTPSAVSDLPAEDMPPEEAGVIFSHNAGFYVESINLTLTCSDPEAVIYFTKDGSPPTSASALKYSEPIFISVKRDVGITTIKAAAVKGEEKTPVITKSYVTGQNVFGRFAESTLIFALSAADYDLYDYYNGVAVSGYLRDEYKRQNGIGLNEYVEPYHPANYNLRGREAERLMYVEVFDSEGALLISQQAGARIVGGYSRDVAQKSWQLYARNEYELGKGMFKYTFFGSELSNTGQLITKYDRIRLRNGANDREFSGIRDELSQQLAREAGFPDTQMARPAAVFLNGAYYGYSWLKEVFCDGYLEQKYGGARENYQIISNTERGESGDEFAVADYARVYELAEGGLADDKKFKKFCSLVDIDNLMLYYAIQVYIDNKDWPGNNVRLWRYYSNAELEELGVIEKAAEPEEALAEPEEAVEEMINPYHDGKWRFMVFDVEFAWSLYGNNNRFYKDDTLKNLLIGNHMGGSSLYLNALLEREDMRQKFANNLCDLTSGAFAPDNVLRVIDELIGQCDDEMMYALENGITVNGSKIPYSEWSSPQFFGESRNMIRDFAENRPEIIEKSLRANLDMQDDGFYTIRFNNPTGAEARLNTKKLTKAGILTGIYFDSCSVPVSMQVYPGYEFDYWEINGVLNRDEDIVITPQMIKDGEVNISLYLKKIAGNELVYISALNSGNNGWVELCNPNEVILSTHNFYLSNDITNLKKWKMPAMNISAESVMLIVCKNNNESDSLKKAKMNFSIKGGQTLYLSDINGDILCAVSVPDMKKKEELRRGISGAYEIIKKQ